MNWSHAKWLACAAIVASATAFPSRAADAPILSASVNASGAVTVTMRLTSGVRYQLLSSPDLATWSNEGQPFVAAQSEVTREFAPNTPARYFRVREDSAAFSAPAALRSITLTNERNATGPLTYTVDLTGAAQGTFFISSGALGQGTFTYTVNGATARFVMTYEDFAGDRDELTLTFREGGSHTFTGTQLTSGDNYDVSGTFTYEAQ